MGPSDCYPDDAGAQSSPHPDRATRPWPLRNAPPDGCTTGSSARGRCRGRADARDPRLDRPVCPDRGHALPHPGSITRRAPRRRRRAGARLWLRQRGASRASNRQYGVPVPDGPATWRGITIRHLLTHTSGIADYTDSTLDTRRDYTEDELVRLAAKQPLEFAPGDRWSYSNTGYVLLGIIIHRVTGVFYGDFLKDHVFRPLGMRTTRIISEADIIPNRSAGYHLVNDTLKNQDWVSPSLNTTADGALYFSVRDLAQWAIALNHWNIPSRAGLEASWTPVRLNNGGTYPYGFGWQVTQQRGYRRIGHGGAWQGFRTAIQRYPDFDLTVIVLDNLEQSLPEAMAVTIAGILEPRLTPPHMLRRAPSEVKPPQPTDRLLQDIAGGVETTHLTPGLEAFISDPLREGVGRRLKGARGWTFVGCDPVEGRGISRLGTQVVQICYARGLGAAPNSLVTVLYGADWRAAGFDFYSY